VQGLTCVNAGSTKIENTKPTYFETGQGSCGMSRAKPLLAEEAPSYRKASFYFAAHPDDWQLFMNPFAFLDVADTATKVVFVHMTAGDAGLGTGTGGRKHPLYLARENGAELAIRFMADADGAPGDKIESFVTVNGHSIRRIGYKNTVNYVLRLPDGNLAGSGYPETGSQSLQRLACGDIDTCSAIDGSAAYHGWADLVAALRAIVDVERARCPAVDLHVPEPDPAINPGDHSDHLATAKAVLDAAGTHTPARWYYHTGYASAALPENLTAQQQNMKSAVFAVTVAGVLALDHGTAWRHYDQAYAGRSCVRIEEDAQSVAQQRIGSKVR
jgi:LmbE family N-acetylglucosaminyl deacetylase